MLDFFHILIFGILMVHLCSSGSYQCDDNHGNLCANNWAHVMLNYNRHQRCQQTCDTDVEGPPPVTPRKSVNDQNSMALVPYMPTLLSAFRQETKAFTFAGRSVTIRQNWEELGVAAVVWDAAVVLAEYIEKQVDDLQLSLDGKSVIELGAGTGLVGLVAALLGGNVALTDRKVALDQLRANLEANLPESGVRSGMTASVKELTWGDNLQEFPEPFDLVIGADIVYLEDTFPKLLETLVHLTRKDSVVLLSCRIRYTRDENFLDMLREKFSVKEVLHEKSRNIHVFQAVPL